MNGRNKSYLSVCRTVVLSAVLAATLLTALPALAIDALTVGVFPRRDPAVTMKLFKPLRAYLEENLGIPVRLETAKDFTAFEAQVAQRRYDLVHFNQYQYLIANKASAYDVLAQNEEFGETRISGAIYVHKDVGITDLEQLKGKTIIFGDGEQAMMSYIVPTYLLRQAGLNKGDYTEQFAKSPPNAVLATFMRQAHAGGAGEVVRRLPLVTGKIDVTQLNLIAVSEPLPHLPWAVKRELPDTLKDQVRALLLELKDTDAGKEILKSAKLTGFNPAQDSDYDAHRAIIEAVEGGVD